MYDHIRNIDPDDDGGQIRSLRAHREHTAPTGEVYEVSIHVLLAESDGWLDPEGWVVNDAAVSIQNAGQFDTSLGHQCVSLLADHRNLVIAPTADLAQERVTTWIGHILDRLDATGELFGATSRPAEDLNGNPLPGNERFETLTEDNRPAWPIYSNDR